MKTKELKVRIAIGVGLVVFTVLWSWLALTGQIDSVAGEAEGNSKGWMLALPIWIGFAVIVITALVKGRKAK